MNDDQVKSGILNSIQNGGKALDRVIEKLYQNLRLRNEIFSFVTLNSGTKRDAEDIFHDGICQLIINVRAGKYRATGSLESYLHMICKNLWLTRLNRKKKLILIKEKLSTTQESSIEENRFYLFCNEKGRLIDNLLSMLKSKCKNILSYWSLGYSFKEIGNLTGKTEAAARKQKYDCMKKLFLILKKRPELVKELNNLNK